MIPTLFVSAVLLSLLWGRLQLAREERDYYKAAVDALKWERDQLRKRLP